MIKTRNLSNGLRSVEELLREVYSIPPDLMNSTEFFSRTEIMNQLVFKVLRKMEEKIIDQDQQIENLKIQLGELIETKSNQ